MAPRPPSASPPGMPGLPQFLPLTRLPSARASAKRVLLTTPYLACFPYFALDIHHLCVHRPCLLSLSTTAPTSFSTLAPSLLWVSPRGTHSWVHPGSHSFPFHLPTFIRSCPRSLPGLSPKCPLTQALSPPPWGRPLSFYVAVARGPMLEHTPDGVSLRSQACSPEDRSGRNL